MNWPDPHTKLIPRLYRRFLGVSVLALLTFQTVLAAPPAAFRYDTDVKQAADQAIAPSRIALRKPFLSSDAPTEKPPEAAAQNASAPNTASKKSNPAPLPLKRTEESETKSTSFISGFSPMKTFGATAAVVGALAIVAWMMRRKNVAALGGEAPTGAFTSLGIIQLGKEQLHLARCGSKALLLHVGAGSVRTLTEIDDPEEVERLCQLCGGGASNNETLDALRDYGIDANGRTLSGGTYA